MTTYPDPPVGVTVHLTDGRTVPVECVYVGIGADGLHTWETTQVFLRSTVEAVQVVKMPARTQVGLRTMTR